jgi:hypothetical protein
MKKLLATLALGVAALPLLSGVASAHGCHRDVQLDRYGWHRHAPDCDRISVRREDRERREYREHRRYDEDRPRCVVRCQYIGPIKTCDRVCR